MAFCVQAPSVFADNQDHKKKGTKEAKTSSQAGKAKTQLAEHGQKAGGASHARSRTETAGKVHSGSLNGVTSRGNKSHGNNTAGADRSMNIGTQNTETSTRSVQQTNQRQVRQTQAATFSVQGNRSNHYNGQWVAGDTHSDWDRNGDHHWNNHDYRWYDGGWLIINVGSSPDYYGAGSTGSNVQAKLAQQGYYHGPIDGDIGPGTRHAIANYEGDNGLEVNGRIDGPLLASLGLE